MKKIKNYIDGKLLEPKTKKYLKNYKPATGKVYSLIPDSGKEDVELAVQSAKKAFFLWSNKNKRDRYKILMNLVKEIENSFEVLVKAESDDTGKPEWLTSSVDIPRCSENIRFFATASLHFDSKLHAMDGDAINYTLKEPIGVVGAISPWNLPLYLLTWKIAPAIAAGNTVVAKPSEVTPYTAFLFSKICKKAGVPPGVINIVHGLGSCVGEEIVKHKSVPVISFTGGTKTGKRIAKISSNQFKKLSLELGGKNPNIIFSDTDIDKAVDWAIKSSFLNQGQICLCGSRIFIEKVIYEKFKSLFVQKTKALVVGDPKNKSSFLGAVVSKDHMKSVLNKISSAKKDGGVVLAGGKRLLFPGKLKGGYFIEPTIIEGLGYLSNTNQEEIFGPVVCLIPFEEEEEVVKMANSTIYGLSASIFTENISRAHRVASKIKSGVVWINSWLIRDLRIPFGGMKSSGLGREGGFNSLNFFTESKNVCLKIDSKT
tara:strand:+ start:42592 stop:44046 length:1455 start_codon:yes stop_codon:yes gene_type:complete